MRACLLCLASGLPWGCSPWPPGPAPWLVTELWIEAEATAQERAWVHGITVAELQRSDGFSLPTDGADWFGWATLREAPPPAKLRLRIIGSGLQLTLSPEEGFGPLYEARVPLWMDDFPDRALSRGLREALSATVAMAAADRAGPETLRALLDGGPHSCNSAELSHHLQSFAVRRVAELRDRGAAPALRQMVQNGATWEASQAQQTLALQAVGSLMALCDRQAVLPMIALSRHKDDEFVVQMAHAVGTVGGPMAEAYLVTLATGHLQAGVREEAGQALRELRRREKYHGGCG